MPVRPDVLPKADPPLGGGGAGLVLSPGPGLSRHWLECMRREGLLVSVGDSRYLCADAAGWPLVRRLTLRTAIPEGCVVIDLTAAWAYGAPVRAQLLSTLTVNAPRGALTSARPGLTVRHSSLPAAAVATVDGLSLTTAARTAADLAMADTADADEALAWFLGPGQVPAETVLAGLRRRGRSRGVRRARRMVELIVSGPRP